MTPLFPSQASGSQTGTCTDAQCQTEDSYLSLSSIDTLSLSLVSVSVSGTDTAPTETAVTSQVCSSPSSVTLTHKSCSLTGQVN